MRGSREGGESFEFHLGSIPAHAGEPQTRRVAVIPPRVYPRPCGGASETNLNEQYAVGLSPPMRGSQTRPLAMGFIVGSIPAHAGEPKPHRFPRQVRRVYPRPCGGAICVFTTGSKAAGLSPPMRGSPLQQHRVLFTQGSIPAHAGEPGAAVKGCKRLGVYPRPCGGAQLGNAVPVDLAGLSPPMRGSPLRPLQTAAQTGSIPAHAGEPLSTY